MKVYNTSINRIVSKCFFFFLRHSKKDQIWQATKFALVCIFHYLMLISDSLRNAFDWHRREEAMLECREHWKKKSVWNLLSPRGPRAINHAAKTWNSARVYAFYCLKSTINAVVSHSPTISSRFLEPPCLPLSIHGF